MKTCEICGQGFISRGEDVLRYGCRICKKGWKHRQEETEGLQLCDSPYAPKKSSPVKRIAWQYFWNMCLGKQQWTPRGREIYLELTNGASDAL